MVFAGLAVSLLGVAGARATDNGQTPALSREMRHVVGFTETVRLFPGDITLRAKVDTGARSSSLHAQDILIFERGGRQWVKFHVTNRENRTQTFERPIVRRVRIRDLGRKSQIRPVILMGICMHNVFRITEVNLSNRAGFNFQLLVGRRFMRQAVIVDPARQFTTQPTCTVSGDALRALDQAVGLPSPNQ
jgi:hypothetical protein